MRRNQGQGAPRVRPINQCIYCGFTSDNIADLSREHIVPQGLGGTETLLKASCADCREITSKFELLCIRKIYWTLRALQGHRSGLRLPDSDKFGVFPAYQPPSLLYGPNNRTHTNFKLCALQGWFTGTQPSNAEICVSTYAVAMKEHGQFLAKIAHCLCIQEYGFGTFEPLLIPVIKGKVSHAPEIWQYVGGWQHGEQDQRVHYYDFQAIVIGYEIYLAVVLRLFAHFGLPTYHIIVGKALPAVALDLPEVTRASSIIDDL